LNCRAFSRLDHTLHRRFTSIQVLLGVDDAEHRSDAPSRRPPQVLRLRQDHRQPPQSLARVNAARARSPRRDRRSDRVQLVYPLDLVSGRRAAQSLPAQGELRIVSKSLPDSASAQDRGERNRDRECRILGAAKCTCPLPQPVLCRPAAKSAAAKMIARGASDSLGARGAAARRLQTVHFE